MRQQNPAPGERCAGALSNAKIAIPSFARLWQESIRSRDHPQRRCADADHVGSRPAGSFGLIPADCMQVDAGPKASADLIGHSGGSDNGWKL